MSMVNIDNKVLSWAVDLDQQTLDQALMTADLPFVEGPVRLMPDAHLGVGAAIGSVFKTRNAIIPSAVGVDIGCGMIAIETNIHTDSITDLGFLRETIEDWVPVGLGPGHERARTTRHHQLIVRAVRGYAELVERHGVHPMPRQQALEKIVEQCGTLGSGNHFIELCQDRDRHVWIMLHTGSRGIGNKIATEFRRRAKQWCDDFMVQLPHPDLAFLPRNIDDFDKYLAYHDWALQYAELNRLALLHLTVKGIEEHLGQSVGFRRKPIQCHHNYVALEDRYYVTRKGAISAREGELGIIPGSMGRESWIVKGKGLPAACHSASHGAGRAMSRTQARNTYTVEDLLAQTAGIESRKDEGVLDELPSAYKDIKDVMLAQRAMVSRLVKLKQFLVVKG